MKSRYISSYFMVSMIALLCVPGCSLLPYESLKFNILDGDTAVKMSSNWLGQYTTTVINKQGMAQSAVTPIDGGHRRTSVYLGNNETLITIDAGGASRFFNIGLNKAPSVLELAPAISRNSKKWKYVGVVVYSKSRGLVFYNRHLAKECIPLFGGGSINYRKSFQSYNRCK